MTDEQFFAENPTIEAFVRGKSHDRSVRSPVERRGNRGRMGVAPASADRMVRGSAVGRNPAAAVPRQGDLRSGALAARPGRALGNTGLVECGVGKPNSSLGSAVNGDTLNVTLYPLTMPGNEKVCSPKMKPTRRASCAPEKLHIKTLATKAKNYLKRAGRSRG
jgi:hypothetical protein